MLRKAIIEGELTEGEPLRQDEIARLFNTSRIPVREAIFAARGTGARQDAAATRAPWSRAFRHPKRQKSFELRALLEPEIIRNAVPRMSEECLAEARSHCQAFSDSTSPMAWGSLNRVFHRTLYSASDLGYFIEVADNAMDRVERYHPRATRHERWHGACRPASTSRSSKPARRARPKGRAFCSAITFWAPRSRCSTSSPGSPDAEHQSHSARHAPMKIGGFLNTSSQAAAHVGRILIAGDASGEVLAFAEGLSFWGGVDPETGRIIDVHHPNHGASVAGKVLLMPTSRGSCSGSGVLLQLSLNAIAPAALVFLRARRDPDPRSAGLRPHLRPAAPDRLAATHGV